MNSRIACFRPDGTFDRNWLPTAGLSTFNGLGTDRGGRLLLVHAVGAATESDVIGRPGLVRLAEGGAPADWWAPPDLSVPRVTFVRMVPGGRSSREARYSPALVRDWHPDGHFLVADGSRYETHFERPRRTLGIVRHARPVPVGDEEPALERESILTAMRRHSTA